MYCGRVKEHFWKPWKQVCDYYDFKDVEMWKEVEAKGFVLQSLDNL